MIKSLRIVCLSLLLFPCIITAQQTNQIKGNTVFQNPQAVKISTPNVTDDWLSNAQSYVARSEYFFKPVTGSDLFAVASKKQRTGFIINTAGFTVSPVCFTDKTKNEDKWKVGMQLAYIGKGAGNIVNSKGTQTYYADENKLTVKHNDFNIEYLNNEEGLRQNFVINKRPSGNLDLSIRLQVTGDLHPVSKNNSIQFNNEKSIAQLYYRDLKVWDANHQSLKAHPNVYDPHPRHLSPGKKHG